MPSSDNWIAGSSRRRFLRLAGAAAAAVPFHALAACASRSGAARRLDRVPHPVYGPLAPVKDGATGLPLLWLPAGFTYHTLGWTGDALDDGSPTPAAHDGMAAFAAGPSTIRLVRNHELTDGPAFDCPASYDHGAGGGTTTLELDAMSAHLTAARSSLSGTVRNCAGGPTPWGAWLTCEETVDGPAADNTHEHPHGYVFEVPADGYGNPEPYRAMGRFRHEAVAIDPVTGITYLTEDAGDRSGFYRFIPAVPGNLGAGGRLEMLGLVGRPQADTRSRQPLRRWLDAVWRTIGDPDPDDPDRRGVFTQGWEQGGARFARLEGAWYGNDRIYFTATTGGAARKGQVWEYDPRGRRLQLLFESPGADVLAMPDNVCVSPRGGLVLCEDGDGDGVEFIHGLTTDGHLFPFARNNVVLSGERNGISGNYTRSEFAGATYSPDGHWLFFNIQSPGITFAVSGPWGEGSL